MRNTIREFFKGFYDKNDVAHQIDHADKVCDLAIEINESLEHPYKNQVVMIAAYAHDMYSTVEFRKIHHELAAHYVRCSNDEIIGLLSPIDRIKVADAVAQHRGSYTGELSSKLSEVISAADRGIPDLEEMIERSLKYNNGNLEKVHEHMKDKFGSKGYAKYPELYEEYFGEVLNTMRKQIDSL